MTTANAPIPPDIVAEIEGLLRDTVDPMDRATLRERLTRDAQVTANRAALWDRRFGEALKLAIEEGRSDPGLYARIVANDQALIDLHRKRVRAIRKGVKKGDSDRRDKHERKLERASRTAKPTLRRFPQRDRDYLEIVGEAEKQGNLDRHALVVSIISKKLKTYRLPHWEKATLSLKAMALSHEIAKEGAQTINLRPSPDICRRAHASPKGPASYMQDAIRRSMQDAFGKLDAPEFWFVIETDDATRFHLHGAVVTPPIINGVALADAALRKAAGKWAASGGHSHQQVSAPLDDPLWWAFYSTKRLTIGRSRIDRKLLASTSRLRAAAEANWDHLRFTLPQSPR